MTKMKKLYLPVLTAAAITFSIFGMPKKAEASCNTYQVNVAKGYLALRTDTAFDSRNEIGELYNGDLVEVMDYTGATGYWYVYSPKLNCYGFVNQEYLYTNEDMDAGTSYFGETRMVSVSKGYLALRNMKAYDASNEIGELYTGDVVQLSLIHISEPTRPY